MWLYRRCCCARTGHYYIGVVGRMAETEEGAAVPGADGERDGRVTAGGGVELPTSGAGRPGPTGAARPLILPETFDGTGSWSEWCYHFENVAAVNGWDGAQKLQWLRVRVTGRAQKARIKCRERTQRVATSGSRTSVRAGTPRSCATKPRPHATSKAKNGRGCFLPFFRFPGFIFAQKSVQWKAERQMSKASFVARN